ncbi:MAG: UDP-N-acetylmuramoyl-tripeptide--D-alanyl-D-alanine ligase [Robiginitomaculum sp.]
MSVLWTHKDAARATGGRAVGNWYVNGLSIDTRSLGVGDLYVPLKDIRDGHEFIPMAYEKGAGAVISEREIEDVPALIVSDSLTALEALAVAARERSGATRIAVTGSVGKTSVKEMIAHICRAAGKTHNSVKSFNNHWGVPLTLAGMPQETQYGVFEMGMNHAGELLALTDIVRPDITIITKIAAAHLEHFKDVEAIAKAKAEIFKGMKTGGIVILNADDEFFKYLSNRANEQGLDIVSVGTGAANVRISNSKPRGHGLETKISGADFNLGLHLQNSGDHHALNAGFALASASILGIDLPIAVKALEALKPLAGRGARFETVLGAHGVIIIDESYNANPTSMRAALAAFGGLEEPCYKIAVLGGMGELGADEIALNTSMIEPILEHGIDKVITVGSLMRGLCEALPEPKRGAWVARVEDVIPVLTKEIKPNSAVLLKASNAIGFGGVVTQLKRKNT